MWGLLYKDGGAECSLDLGIVVNVEVDKQFRYLLQKEFTVAGLCDWGGGETG